MALREARCRRTLLKTVDGGQHLLLRSGGAGVQLRCLGEDIRTAPLALEIVLESFPQIDRRQAQIRWLAAAFRSDGPPPPPSDWTVEAMRHRDALAALDRRMVGWPYRRIAAFLYGEDAVDADWSNPDQAMKNRLIRSVRRGFRLMRGGYRTLLA